MSFFDISLIIILGGFTFSGLSKGLIRLLGHLVGLIIGAYIASHYYLLVFQWGEHLAKGHDSIGKVVAFILLFIVATRLIYLAFFLIEKFFNLIAIIPGSKYINNILGGLLGFLEGSLFLGLIIFVVSRYTLITNFFGSELALSKIAPLLLKITDIIMPFLPAALKALQSII
jgi:uncharacterized membrane protein required for colicin V production